MLRGGVSTDQISRLSVGQASFFNFCFGVNFLNFSEFWPDGSQAKNDKRSPKPEIQPREMSDGMTCVFQENGIGEVCGAPIWKETRDGMVLKICKKYAIWIASLDKPCRMTCCSQTHHGRVAGGCMYVHFKRVTEAAKPEDRGVACDCNPLHSHVIPILHCHR